LYYDLREIDTHITEAIVELRKMKTKNQYRNRKIEYRIYEIKVMQEINRRITLILDISNKPDYTAQE